MILSRVTIHFDGNGRVYRPGEVLSGEYRVDGVGSDRIKAVEVSVLWFTEGKGDEDLAVHHFDRLEPADGAWTASPRRGRFETVLPASPLTYDGVIVKLRWCVRVRVFLERGKELVGQVPFKLGDLRAAKMAAT